MRQRVPKPHECRLNPNIESHRQNQGQSDVQCQLQFEEKRTVVIAFVNEHYDPTSDRKCS